MIDQRVQGIAAVIDDVVEGFTNPQNEWPTVAQSHRAMDMIFHG